MEDKNKHESRLDLTPEEKFRTSLEIRNMEIHLFWQRSNFFLALTTAIAIGFFTLTETSAKLPLAFLGLISSVLWFLVNLGSKFWQARWEEKLRDVESELFPNLNFFKESYDVIRPSVERSLSRQMGKRQTVFRRLIIRAVLIKPSVSSLVIYLSVFFCIFWLVYIIIILF